VVKTHRFLAAGMTASCLLAAPRIEAQVATDVSGTPPVLTLGEALALAAANNRSIASAELELGKAADRLGAVKAQRYPALTFDATAARTLNTVEFQVSEGTFGSYPGIGPIPGANTKVTTPPKWTVLGLANLKQPLSQLYKLGLGVKEREQLLDSAKEDLRQGRQSVAHEVRRLYYAIVGAESSLTAARESLALVREVERVVGERARVAATLEHETVDAKASLARAEYQVAYQETTVASARQQLNSLLGRDVNVDFRVAPLPEARPVTDRPDEAAARALERRPDVRRARLKTDVADLDAKVAKAEYLPDISLAGTYFHPFQLEFQPKDVWSVGFIVQWDVFDGGKRAKDVAEKRKAAEQARLAVADAEASARVDVSRDWRRLRDAERLVRAAELARDAMRDRMRVARVRYESQAVLAQDLLKAQADLAEADHNWNEALVSYWTARADYDSSTGEDL